MQELHEVKIWVLSGVVVLLVGLVGWAGKYFIEAVLKKMDVLIQEVRKLSDSSLQLQGQVNRNRECIEEHKGRLDDHNKRITRLERATPLPGDNHSSEL